MRSIDRETTRPEGPGTSRRRRQLSAGRPRAAEAIAFALEVDARGFHLYAAGSPGCGRESTVMAAVHVFAGSQPTPPDWVYVHNFVEPDRPRAFRMPAGEGRRLARAMAWFVEAAQQQIPRAFEGEDYARRREKAVVEAKTLRTDLRSTRWASCRQRTS